MSLVKVGDTVLLQFKTVWFLWEPAWERYRPITSLDWDGDALVVNDRAYCADPMDPEYGYGTAKMREVCTLLSRSFPPSKAQDGPLPVVGRKEWFYDRYASLTPCAPRDRASWKRFHKGRYRTPKAAPKTRLTRRRI